MLYLSSSPPAQDVRRGSTRQVTNHGGDEAQTDQPADGILLHHHHVLPGQQRGHLDHGEALGETYRQVDQEVRSH